MLLGLFVFVIGAIVLVTVLRNQGSAERRSAAEVKQRRYAEEEAIRQEALKARDAHFEQLRNVWTAQNTGSFEGQDCIFAVRHDYSQIAIMPFNMDGAFLALEPIIIPKNQLRGVGLGKRSIQITHERVEVVPVAVQNKKSPVARAIVGGLVAGPAGLVIGAASGLGGKSVVHTEERKVRQQEWVDGASALLLETHAPNSRKLTVEFVSRNVAEYWVDNLRAAMVRP